MVNESLRTRLFNTAWDMFTEYFQENTTGLYVTATKPIFIRQNKQQPHHTQTNSAAELHSV
jgi:hypothetical protein